METNTVKTIKSFTTTDEIINYLNSINYTEKTPLEIKEEIKINALIKYGCIVIFFDPYKLLD